MRESFGGAFMIKLVLIFIVIYVSFMAVAINYAKAFRVKNNVINILEQSQFELGDSITEIDDYLSNVPYNLNGNDSIKKHCNNTEFGNTNKSTNTILTTNGVCIVKQATGSDNEVYYKVTSYISVDFRVFNIYMTLPISGETKIIRY